jgi:hypothetical protein
MRLPRPLPESALAELATLLKQCKDKATYQRVPCLWLRAALGWSAPQVAQALGWSLRAGHHVPARSWRHGSAALLGPGRGGRAHAHRSVTQEPQLLAHFAVSATQGGVVEASPVRRAYEAAVGHTVPKSALDRLWSRPGWRKLAPRPRHRAASEAAQEAFPKSSVAWCAPRCSAKDSRAAPCG